MNYIREINAFYDEMLRNPLSASAVTLWHALMHMNNKAMWSESFTAPGNVLQFKSGLTESSFKRARNELVEEGFIVYIPSKNRKPPTYKIISLYKEPVWDTDMRGPSPLSSHVEDGDHASERHQTVHDESDSIENDENRAPVKEAEDVNEHTTPLQKNEQASSTPNPKAPQSTARHATPYSDHNMTHTPDHLTNHKVSHNTNHQTAPLYKQYINKKRQNKTSSDTASSPALSFFHENFGKPKTHESREIEAWTKKLGDDLVIKAMERALEWNVPTWNYVKGILQSWRDKGISTVEDAWLEGLEFKDKRNKRKQSFYHQSFTKTDLVPDWFEEQKRKNARKEEKERLEREEELSRMKDPHYANQVREDLEGLLGSLG